MDALLRVASAQTPEEALRAKIAGVRYAPLAEQARIQGDVRLNLKSGIVTLLCGHPLLAQIAGENAKAFESIEREEKLETTYHFVCADTTASVPTSITDIPSKGCREIIANLNGDKLRYVMEVNE